MTVTEYGGIRPWLHVPTCGTCGARELSQQFCELHSSQLMLQRRFDVSGIAQWAPDPNVKLRTSWSVPLCAPHGVTTRGAVQVSSLNNSARCLVEFGPRVAGSGPGANWNSANRCEGGRRRPIGTRGRLGGPRQLKYSQEVVKVPGRLTMYVGVAYVGMSRLRACKGEAVQASGSSTSAAVKGSISQIRVASEKGNEAVGQRTESNHHRPEAGGASVRRSPPVTGQPTRTGTYVLPAKRFDCRSSSPLQTGNLRASRRPSRGRGRGPSKRSVAAGNDRRSVRQLFWSRPFGNRPRSAPAPVKPCRT